MRLQWKLVAASGLTVLVGACGGGGSRNEAAETNVTAGSGPEMNAVNAPPAPAPGTSSGATNTATSGMPVPGTNTPEHIVVNDANAVSDVNTNR